MDDCGSLLCSDDWGHSSASAVQFSGTFLFLLRMGERMEGGTYIEFCKVRHGG